MAVARKHADVLVPQAANPQFPVRREARIGRIVLVLLGPVSREPSGTERRAVTTGARRPLPLTSPGAGRGGGWIETARGIVEKRKLVLLLPHFLPGELKSTVLCRRSNNGPVEGPLLGLKWNSCPSLHSSKNGRWNYAKFRYQYDFLNETS